MRALVVTLLLVSAFAPPAAAGTWLDEQVLEHDGGPRFYRVYVPDEPAPPEGWPLVLVLHGGGGGMRNVMNRHFGEWVQVADEHGVLLAVPNGVDWATGDPAGDEQHWNDCRGDERLSEKVVDDVGFLAALLDAIAAAHPVDPERIYANGASNGGMMSYRLAYELGHRVAAVAAFIANQPAVPDCAGPGYPVSILIMNGDAETHYMPWDGGCVTPSCDRGTVRSAERTRDDWVAMLGLDPIADQVRDYDDLVSSDGATVTRWVHLGGVDGTELFFYRVRGGGHTVPTIEHPTSAAWRALMGLGNQCRDIEAVRHAWAFFERHTLHGLGGAEALGETGILSVTPGETTGMLTLKWQPDCGGATHYGVYRGELAAGLASAVPAEGLCAVESFEATLPDGAEDAEFFLVVPNDGAEEGDWGPGRVPPVAGCYPQSVPNACAAFGR